MAFVANADALIIDLRENGGGSASMIQLLAGYLFKDSVHLIDWYSRREDKTTQSWSNDWVPGKTMYETPVYVLVSGRTGSAAEEFTFDLKNQKRATIVGETTGGAGHTVEFHVYDMGSFTRGAQASERAGARSRDEYGLGGRRRRSPTSRCRPTRRSPRRTSTP